MFWRSLTRPWLAPLLGQVALCRGLVAAAGILGVAHMLGYSLWPCFFANLTGLPCPGCGMTRATTALFRGDIQMAMAYHPFSPGFVVLGILMTFVSIAPPSWRQSVVRAVSSFEVNTRLPTIFLLATFTYGLLRMGGICSSAAEIKPSPVRAFLSERWSGGR